MIIELGKVNVETKGSGTHLFEGSPSDCIQVSNPVARWPTIQCGG
jgi:hypothetical protein